MKYKIDIDIFQGPMDLLLHLIDRDKLDIYDIPINDITEQFIEYLYKMEELNLEIASEFLLMAATLIEIKSKMLLPIEKKDNFDQLEMEDLDPRADLVRKLIEYRKFKNASEELKEYEHKFSKVYYRPKEDLMGEERIEINLDNLRVEMLVKALNNIIQNRSSIDGDITLSEIQRDEYTLEECIDEIKLLAEESERLLFSELLGNSIENKEIIVYFLSILELMKMKIINVVQEEDFSDIIIYSNVSRCYNGE